jgi:hypothetical protein
MAVRTTDIHGAGPDGAAFDVGGFTGSSLSRRDLALGDWTISAIGRNQAGDAVLSGSGTATINLGLETSLTLTLRPLVGSGDLSLTVSWTAGLFASPTITGNLAPQSGAAISLAFVPGGDGHSFGLSASGLDTGYYALDLTLLDGAEPRWTMVETVRIVKDKATSASYAISSGDIYLGTVRLPTISPAAGSYSGGQSVAISCETPGASIRYTNDGSLPTPYNGSVYIAPFTVSSTTMIRARAFKPNWFDSLPAAAALTLSGTAATPVVSPPSGLHYDPVSVTLTSATPGTTFVYTTDGSTPTASHGTSYSGPIAVGSDTTIKAIANLNDQYFSDVAEAIYKITGHASAPALTVAAGTYTSAQTVGMSCGTPGAKIYYTIDGTEPSETGGTLYSGAVPISASCTLKARAYKQDWDGSALTSAAYRITAVPPLSSVPVGTYNDSKSVALSSATLGAEIRYTTGDGTQAAPTATTGTVYSTPIPVEQNLTIKAIARGAGLDDSDAVSFAYELKPYAPTFDPPPGDYLDASMIVTLASATPGAGFLYTIGDGSQAAPTAISGNLGSSVSLNASRTVKAIAKKAGWSVSGVSGAVYTLGVSTVSPSDGGSTSDAAPLLDWADAAGALGYKVQYSSSEAGVPTATEYPISVSQYRMAISLAVDERCYWRFQVRGSSGTWGSWSPVYSFTHRLVPRDGLVGEWLFEGNALDSSGNGRNGSVNGPSLTSDRFGRANAAYSFDGIDDYIDVGNTGDIPAGTIAVWVTYNTINPSPTVWSDNRDVVLTWGNAYGGDGDEGGKVALNWDSGQKLALVLWEDAGAWHSAMGDTLPSVGAWHLVVGTWGPSGMNTYLDGALSGHEEYFGGLVTYATMLIGSNSWTGWAWQRHAGKIDSVRLYDRRLGLSEIQGLYAEGGWTP